MTNQKILVPVDFSEVSSKVVEVASFVAEKSNMPLVLLHVNSAKSETNPLAKMKELVSGMEATSSVSFEFMVKQGNVFEEITKAASDDQFKFMVIGSHGYKGLREKVFGADILKLLKSITIPALTVQKNYTLHTNGFSNILFPVSSHRSFQHQINATVAFAKIFKCEVHLYSVEKPGMQWSKEIVDNIKFALTEFEANGISFQKIKETQDSFSVGYAKQIMDYAKRANMNMIAFMANATKEHYYIADADKVSMLTNDACIPILSSNDKTIL